VKVRWTPEAEDDRAQIFDYIAADSPRSAVNMDELFSKVAARLGEHPQYGRTGRIPGTREVIPHKSTAWSTRSSRTPSGCSPWCVPPGSGRL